MTEPKSIEFPEGYISIYYKEWIREIYQIKNKGWIARIIGGFGPTGMYGAIALELFETEEEAKEWCEKEIARMRKT